MNLIRSIRKLRLITKILMTERSRMLLKFSRKNLLELSSSSSDSDDNKVEIMKLIENKNDLVKLAIV